ncbi:unannotated protein [freshwater metagenome]|uniref:Unannotated protein n=1 Tax=freshwater metagenome TaxID=449393 RepID=A0A6J6HRX7_9ZZZZ
MAVSILPNMMFIAELMRPTSVFECGSIRRRPKSPAATASAVRSTSFRGRSAEEMVSQIAKALSSRSKDPKRAPMFRYWMISALLLSTGKAITKEPGLEERGTARMRQPFPSLRSMTGLPRLSISNGTPWVSRTEAMLIVLRFGTGAFGLVDCEMLSRNEPSGPR